MGSLGEAREDLTSKLREVLLAHQIQLQPAVNYSNPPPGSQNSSINSTCTPSQSDEYGNDAHLAYISQILMDDEFEDVEQGADHSQSYQPLLDEFTSIIQPENNSNSQRLLPPIAQGSKVDIHGALMKCARAVATNNTLLFFNLARELTSLMSPAPSPDPVERAAVLFLEALNAKITGIGSHAYRALAASISAKQLLNMRMLNFPSFFVSHVFANETILRACRGARRIHIVDFGISFGCQWPGLLQALAQRDEGPPELLRITAVDYPDTTSLLQTEKRLVEFASALGIHLEYVPVGSSSWELVQPAQNPDEFLVVNCSMSLRHLKDDSIAVNHPRTLFFENVYNMRPDVFVMCEGSVGSSSPFFMTRFQEALWHYTAKMEYYDTWIDDKEQKSFMERRLARNVMNVIGCQGQEQIERSDKYNAWDLRAKRAGFQQMPLDDDICQKTKAVWGGYKYNRNFGFGIDENWLLLGWKDIVIFGMSAWRPKSRFIF